MIHVVLRGDLGNQLFQYAVGRKLALIYQTDLTLHTANRHSIFDPTGNRLKHKLRLFHLKAHFDHRPFLWSRLRLQRLASSTTIYQESGWGFTPEVLALPDNCYLFGYFQSEKYFRDLAPLLRYEFEISDGAFSKSAKTWQQRIDDGCAVAVHVRLGDFLKSSNHHVCSVSYYKRAIEYVRERHPDARFFFFSDDLEWCQAQFAGEPYVFVQTERSADRPLVDFWLMGRCQHHIISNSTFSWWPAWLNPDPQKIVIAPNKWSNDLQLNRLAMRDTVPDNWVKIDVD